MEGAKFAALLNREHHVILDNSGSMITQDIRDRNGAFIRDAYGQPLNRKMHTCNCVHEFAKQILNIGGYFSMSIFSDNFVTAEIKNVRDVSNLYYNAGEPSGSTDLALVLKAALEKFFAEKESGLYAKELCFGKKVGKTIVVVTDGQPNDKIAVKNLIVDASKRIDYDEQLAISLVQVGADAEATTYLQSLDDELVQQTGFLSWFSLTAWMQWFGFIETAKFDIVDTITVQEIEQNGLAAGVQKALYKAITD